MLDGMLQRIFWKNLHRNLEECFSVDFNPNVDVLRGVSSSKILETTVLKDINNAVIMGSVPDIKVSNSSFFGLSWLFSEAPCFPVNGNKVTIIHEPSIFYKTLLEKSKTAKQRITLASLYLGTGHLEKNLVSAIEQNLNNSKGQLKVKILLDFVRGSRGEVNSRHMLLPLLQQFNESCQVSLYHTPQLRGILRKILPERFNEVIGLQHIKVYLFDDALLISGANLSNDYFTNRQDRYILIEDCPKLANFYDTLVSRVCNFSFRLDQDNRTCLPSSWNIHPFYGDKEQFKVSAMNHVWDLFEGAIAENKTCSLKDCDTWIFPLVEMGSLGLHHDSKVTKNLLETAQESSSIYFATGYFNLTEDYMNSILNNSSAHYKFLMAHPTANGFLGAKGLAGGIPAAYTLIAWKFLKSIQAVNKHSVIKLLEYRKPGWTYHGKGLWYTLPEHTRPVFTLVGSSNFGARSVDRDLESQVAIVTVNPCLQQHLLKEQEHLFNHGVEFSEDISTPDRKPPYWVYLFVSFFRNYF